MTITETMHSKLPGYDTKKNTSKSLGAYRLVANVPVVAYEPTEDIVRQQIIASVYRLLEAGQPIPDDIATPIIEARQQDAAQLERVRIIDSAVRDIHAQAEVDERTVLPALTYLREELDRVVTEAKTASAQLGDISTAEQALDADKTQTAAWKTLTQLLADYNEIRTNQRILYRDSIEEFSGTRAFDHIGSFADAIDVHPYWVDQRYANAVGSSTDNSWVQKYAKWLAEVVRPADSLTRPLTPRTLGELVTETTPWVPTPEQYLTALNTASGATDIVTPNNLEFREDQRDLYYETTGAAPLTALDHSPRITSRRNGYGMGRMTKAKQAISDRVGEPNQQRESTPIAGW